MKRLRHIRPLLLALLFTLCHALTATAQTVKNITVSNDNPYTDHISLKDDSRDMALMVKFAFDEPTNTLRVTLISYRPLFVFPVDTPCRQLAKRRKVNADKLPFVVNAEPATTYRFTKEYWQAIDKPRKKHVFKKWIDCTAGLSPMPMEYNMVNDYVEQDFSITNKANAAIVTLHDVLMLEQDTEAKAGKKRYDIVWGGDINTDYIIDIQRDPCFGLDEELSAADNLLNAVTAAYGNLTGRYGSGVVDNKESLNNFNEMRQLLLEQYPHRNDSTACPVLQEKWDSYNTVVDNIAAMTCSVRKRTATATGGAHGAANAQGSGAHGALNAGYILTQARQIDNAVARWLATKDAAERADMKKQCADIIKMVEGSISRQRSVTQQQHNAIKIFRQAESYYKSVCR